MLLLGWISLFHLIMVVLSAKQIWRVRGHERKRCRPGSLRYVCVTRFNIAWTVSFQTKSSEALVVTSPSVSKREGFISSEKLDLLKRCLACKPLSVVATGLFLCFDFTYFWDCSLFLFAPSSSTRASLISQLEWAWVKLIFKEDNWVAHCSTREVMLMSLLIPQVLAGESRSLVIGCGVGVDLGRLAWAQSSEVLMCSIRDIQEQHRCISLAPFFREFLQDSQRESLFMANANKDLVPEPGELTTGDCKSPPGVVGESILNILKHTPLIGVLGWLSGEAKVDITVFASYFEGRTPTLFWLDSLKLTVSPLPLTVLAPFVGFLTLPDWVSHLRHTSLYLHC